MASLLFSSWSADRMPARAARGRRRASCDNRAAKAAET